MNKEKAAQLLPIIQAFADGKTIQLCKSSEGWEDMNESIQFSCEANRYRIKTEPMEVEMWISDTTGKVVKIGDSNDESKPSKATLKTFREIL